MRFLPVGDHAVLVECADLAQMRSLHAAVQASPIRATDVVPGARTLLLDGLEDPDDVVDRLRALPLVEVASVRAPLVEIPVRYDGPDLTAVAEHWGVSPEEVAGIHADVEYVAAFCGFAPGFAYLAGLPEDRAVPRLPSPRAHVPAGAVGLAGAFTGVYPRSSPGGWQLIGRTDVVLWRPDREQPALLAPGTRVRFVPRG